MRLRLGLIGLTLTSLGALAPAIAADVYRGPAGGGYKDLPYAAIDWSGFYAGVNGGGAWAGNDQLVDLVSNSNPFFGLSPSGGFGGGQIGYNWQGIWYPRLVLGVEADIQGAGISDRGTVFDAPSGLTFHFKSDLDFFGTVRGRVGYAMDNALFYFTGGFAFGGLRKSSDDFGPPTQRFDGTATGFVLGGGAEYKFTPAWSAKVEYQYLNFGKNDVCGFGNGCFSDFANAGPQKDDDFHTVRVGLNYYFLPVYAPLK